MFGTVIVLMSLILITPNLLGRPSELTSVSELVVAMNHDETKIIVDVTAAVQAYLYDNLTLEVKHMNPDLSNVTLARYSQNDSYNVQVEVPANATPLWIHARLVDIQGNYFEYNVTVRMFYDQNNGYKLTLAFNFPDEPSNGPRYTVPPADFRWPIPRRGMLP
jgi:hypothetical protein